MGIHQISLIAELIASLERSYRLIYKHYFAVHSYLIMETTKLPLPNFSKRFVKIDYLHVQF